MRDLSKASNSKVNELINKINAGINTLLVFYPDLYNEKETRLLRKTQIILRLILFVNKKISEESINLIESTLKPLFMRSWEKELQEGKELISWFKSDVLGDIPPIVSVTFGNSEPFCNGKYGICYEILSPKAFIGANYKDSSTVIESISRKSIYTLREYSNMVVNAYNLTTPLITPYQIEKKLQNDYKSKHNEVILDSQYIRPIKVIYTNDFVYDIVEKISQKYHLPIEYRGPKHY